MSVYLAYLVIFGESVEVEDCKHQSFAHHVAVWNLRAE